MLCTMNNKHPKVDKLFFCAAPVVTLFFQKRSHVTVFHPKGEHISKVIPPVRHQHRPHCC